MATIYICNHCGGSSSKGSKFCRGCKTIEQRGEMCKNNLENNPKYTCKICGINQIDHE